MKAVISVLVAVGFFLFIVGLVFGQIPILVIGLAMLGGGFYIGLRPGGFLTKESVLDTWHVLLDQACVEDGEVRAESLTQDTYMELSNSEAPNLKAEKTHISPSLIRGLTGDTRPFLVLTDLTNYRLSPYKIYISARPYGTGLAAEWNLTYKPTLLLALLSLIPFVNLIPKTLSDLDLFDQQDLRAYATNVHHCMLRSVSKLMESLNQDPSKLNRQSKGFLAVT
jgi:hypothetical protein